MNNPITIAFSHIEVVTGIKPKSVDFDNDFVWLYSFTNEENPRFDMVNRDILDAAADYAYSNDCYRYINIETHLRLLREIPVHFSIIDYLASIFSELHAPYRPDIPDLSPFIYQEEGFKLPSDMPVIFQRATKTLVHTQRFDCLRSKDEIVTLTTD